MKPDIFFVFAAFSVPPPSRLRSRLSRRTILWGVAAGVVALTTGGYLTYRGLTAPHILTYAEQSMFDGILDASWSPDGKQVAVTSYTGGHYWVPTYGSLSVFDASSGERLAQYNQGRFDIRVKGMDQMAWSPNGKYLLVLNGQIDIWSMETLLLSHGLRNEINSSYDRRNKSS